MQTAMSGVTGGGGGGTPALYGVKNSANPDKKKGRWEEQRLEPQSGAYVVCGLLIEKKKKINRKQLQGERTAI